MRVGNYTVTLHAYTPQGVTETIALNVHVTQILAKEALKNVDHGADTVAQNVNDAGRKAGSFLRWIAGFFGA